MYPRPSDPHLNVYAEVNARLSDPRPNMSPKCNARLSDPLPNVYAEVIHAGVDVEVRWTPYHRVLHLHSVRLSRKYSFGENHHSSYQGVIGRPDVQFNAGLFCLRPWIHK